jgi:hypothetical protein
MVQRVLLLELDTTWVYRIHTKAYGSYTIAYIARPIIWLYFLIPYGYIHRSFEVGVLLDTQKSSGISLTLYSQSYLDYVSKPAACEFKFFPLLPNA